MVEHLSKIDAVVDRLVELCTAATAADALQVIDGPFVGELADAVLIFGIPDGSLPGYRSRIERQDGFGRVRLTEEWEVRCLLSLASGANDVAALRSRAVAVFGLIDEALRDNVQEDGVWDLAGFDGQADWVPLLGPAGATMSVLFTIAGATLL